MPPVAAVARMVARIAFLVQLLLGIGLWTGRLDAAKGVHILVGVVFVISVWTVAAVAATRAVALPLVGLGIAWGILVAIFGLTQETILMGSVHWVVQILHLLAGMVALGLAEATGARLAKAASSE